MMRGALLLTANLLMACVLKAQDVSLSNVEIRVSKVAGSVYLLRGAGGNIAASVGDDGIVLIDDESAPLADKVQAALQGITDKPVRFVINTHYHGDHIGGNAHFKKQATLIAHDNVRRRMESGGSTGNGGSMHFEAKPQAKDALPVITYDHAVTLHLNGEDIRVLHFASGHTDGDSIIFFPKSNVVHMGDEFVTHFPFVDVEAGGSLQGMINAVENVIAHVQPDVKVIPGHGQVSSLGDLRAYLTMLKATRDAVAHALKDGKTLDQMKQAKILDPWKRYSGEFVNEDAFLETLYISVAGQKSAAP
ncbi:MAG TPA: MBL fold metallo-hydrolase [Steroidobacteraceae bacterium]|jgi:cyclase|nr:MBL fold metallo-hydrolase [Steroidobacteraceae bacterium]